MSELRCPKCDREKVFEHLPFGDEFVCEGCGQPCVIDWDYDSEYSPCFWVVEQKEEAKKQENQKAGKLGGERIPTAAPRTVFRCPTCGQRFQPEQIPGLEVFSCSKCGQSCRVAWPSVAPEPPRAESRGQSSGSLPNPLELPSFRASELPHSVPQKEPMIDFKKKRFLVIVDRDHAKQMHQVLEGYDWARVVDLDSEGFPLPPGQRLVSEAAWQVLRAGAKIPLKELTDSVEALGTKYLAENQRTAGERWTVAELHRRALGETEDFDE